MIKGEDEEDEDGSDPPCRDVVVGKFAGGEIQQILEVNILC